MAINQNWVELLRKKKFPGRSTILRFFHFGPFIAFALIFSISIITYYYAFVRKWPLLQPLPARIPHYLRSAFFSYATLERVIPLNALNCAAYCLCVGLLLWHYIIAIVKGPGYAEAGWVPKNLPQPDQHLQFCSQCFAFKPPRAHHCKSCNRCVYKMDHHCPWINNCVGHHNHKSFILFLVYTIISCTYSTFLLIPCVLDIIYPIWRRPRFGIRHSEATPLIVITFAALMAFALVIALGMLLWGQLEGVNENATFIEAWIISKAERRAKVEDLDPFIYPYDLGCWRNWKTVFGDRVISWGLVWPFCQKPASLSSSFIGDGVNYRVLSECDQYSLTREQLQQKKNKKKLKKQQRVLIRDTFSPTQGVWGKCPPVLLYNMCLGGNKLTHTISYSSIIGAFADGVTLHEDLMIVNAGDVVEVTRVNKHWLYGHKLTDEEVEALKNEHNNNNNNNNDDDDEDVEDDDEIEPGLVKEKKDAKDGSESRKRKANSNETEGEKGLICKEYHERGWFPRVCVQAKGTKQQ